MSGFVVRIKAIKSIKKFLYFLSSYINLQLLQPQASKTSYQHNDDRGIWFDCMLVMMDCYRMRLVVLALLLIFAIILLNLTSKGLISPQDYSTMNYTLDSTIHQSLNLVMTARLSIYKSRFVSHFRIAYYQEELISNKKSVKTLWNWCSKNNSNFVQSAVLLSLYSQLYQ